MNVRTFGLALFTIVPLLALAPVACSSGATMPGALQNTGSGGPPSGGGGGGGGSDTDAATVGTDGAVPPTPTGCTTLDLNTTGPCKTFKASGEAQPLGGTIESGTYAIDSETVFGADGGAATCDIRYEITFTASSTTTGSVQVAYELGQQELLTTASGSYTTSGNVLTFVFSCEAFNGTATSASTMFLAYTASGGTITLYGTPFASSSSNPSSVDLSDQYVLGLR